MTDHLPSKDVTLADLQRAMDDAAATWDDKNASDYRAAVARADAWRTAFEWLKGWDLRTGDPSASGVGLLKEYTEGMALVEKLR